MAAFNLISAFITLPSVPTFYEKDHRHRIFCSSNTPSLPDRITFISCTLYTNEKAY